MTHTDYRSSGWRFVVSYNGKILGASEYIYPTQALATQHGDLFFSQAMEGIAVSQRLRKTHLEK